MLCINLQLKRKEGIPRPQALCRTTNQNLSFPALTSVKWILTGQPILYNEWWNSRIGRVEERHPPRDGAGAEYGTISRYSNDSASWIRYKRRKKASEKHQRPSLKGIFFFLNTKNFPETHICQNRTDSKTIDGNYSALLSFEMNNVHRKKINGLYWQWKGTQIIHKNIVNLQPY